MKTKPMFLILFDLVEIRNEFNIVSKVKQNRKIARQLKKLNVFAKKSNEIARKGSDEREHTKMSASKN